MVDYKQILRLHSEGVSQRGIDHVHREMARPSVTLLLLWNEYIQDAGRLVGCLSGIPSSLNSIADG